MNRSTVQIRPAAPFYKGLRGDWEVVYQLIVSKYSHYCAKTKKVCSLKKETALLEEDGIYTQYNNLRYAS